MNRKSMKGGVQVSRRRRPGRRSGRQAPTRRAHRTPHTRTRTRSRSASNIRAECNSIYSALNYVPEDPTKSNEEKNAIVARLEARRNALGCGNSGRTN